MLFLVHVLFIQAKYMHEKICAYKQAVALLKIENYSPYLIKNFYMKNKNPNYNMRYYHFENFIAFIIKKKS